jgi:hypothetical protein
LKKEGVDNVFFTTYKVLPIGYMEGLIMYLPNKISISQIKENFKNLNIYLNHLKEGKCDECKKVIDDNYFKTAGIYKFIFI